MNLTEKLAFAALHRIDPEFGHGLSIKALKLGLTPRLGPVTSARLRCSLAGMELPNPIGLAAGFDKNAEVIAPLLHCGFGFIEVGAATPLPQSGNPKPRLFRLKEDKAAINRFGFNNQGAAVIASRLAKRPKRGIVGLNLGANKTSADRAADFASVLTTCGDYVDFVTVNVSSPNTERLRDLQGKEALSALLNGVMSAREALEKPLPVFLKIAPDLSDNDLKDIAEVARAAQLDAVIATNTTLSRDGLVGADRGEAGGLSGVPLFEKSTRILGQLSLLLGDDIPLIGVGGIGSAEQAYTKIRAGASVVQLYTALVYQGFSMVNDVARDLEALLVRDGFANVAEAVGVDKEKYR